MEDFYDYPSSCGCQLVTPPPPRVFWVSEINQFESDDVQPRDIPIWSMRHQALRSIPVVILGVPIPIIQFWPYTWPWINKVIKSGHWSSEIPDHLLNVTCLCVLQSVSYVAIDVQICTITGQFTSLGQRELIYLNYKMKFWNGKCYWTTKISDSAETKGIRGISWAGDWSFNWKAFGLYFTLREVRYNVIWHGFRFFSV